MLRILYIIYAVVVTLIVTSCNYGANGFGNYRGWGGSSYGGGGYGGGGFGGGGHK